MVDINLFKDDEEEKEWKPTPGEGEELGGEPKEDLGLDGNVSESSLLDDEGLLGDEEPIPDFGEPEEKEKEEDYEFGEVKEKKTPVWFWAFLGIVVVGVFLYLFVYLPQQNKTKRAASPEVRRPALTDRLKQESQARGQITSAVDSGTASQPSSIQRRVGAAGVRSVDVFVEATKVIFANLTQEGQLGTIILDGDRFHVGYVSETPNVSQAMGHRIKTLLGASEFRVSPEDRHRTGGRVHYWGVVSGVLPQKSLGLVQTSTKTFATADSFIEGMKGLVQQHRLALQQTEKYSERSEKGIRHVPVRLKIEGSKTQTLTFLDALKGFQGNYNLAKLTLAPVVISDFQANQVKLVLEFQIAVS
jgi:hypothetical protein